MTGVLITFHLASFAFLGWAFWSGYSSTAVRAHIVIALGATALSVFSHCMTMMYVVAVGRMIRQTVEKAGLNQSYVAKTKGYRSKVFRAATFAMVMVMLQTILGGGAHTKALPLWVHVVLGFLTMLLSSFAIFLEIHCLIGNHLLGHQAAREFEKTTKTPRH